MDVHLRSSTTVIVRDAGNVRERDDDGAAVVCGDVTTSTRETSTARPMSMFFMSVGQVDMPLSTVSSSSQKEKARIFEN